MARRRIRKSSDESRKYPPRPPSSDFDEWDPILEMCEDMDRSKQDHRMSEGRRASLASIAINRKKVPKTLDFNRDD